MDHGRMPLLWLAESLRCLNYWHNTCSLPMYLPSCLRPCDPNAPTLVCLPSFLPLSLLAFLLCSLLTFSSVPQNNYRNLINITQFGNTKNTRTYNWPRVAKRRSCHQRRQVKTRNNRIMWGKKKTQNQYLIKEGPTAVEVQRR